jgi:hypothetical protein
MKVKQIPRSDLLLGMTLEVFNSLFRPEIDR